MTMVDINWIEKNKETLKSVYNILYILIDENIKALLFIFDGQKLTRHEIVNKTKLGSATVHRLLNKLQKIGFVSCQEVKISKILPNPGSSNHRNYEKPAINGEKVFYLNYQHIGDLLSIINTCNIYESSNDLGKRLILKQHSNSSIENCMIDSSILEQLQSPIKSLCSDKDIKLLKKIEHKAPSDIALIIDCMDVFYMPTDENESIGKKIIKVQPTVNRHLINLEEIGFIKRDVVLNNVKNTIQTDKLNTIINLLKNLSKLKLKYPIQSRRPVKLKLPNNSILYHGV